MFICIIDWSTAKPKATGHCDRRKINLLTSRKGLFTIKKQLAKSQREKAMSDQDRVEQRSKAIKQKKRADELQRDIKSLESGIETVRLLNMQNENVTQHDYDVINWKFRSIVKLVREVESIATSARSGKDAFFADYHGSAKCQRIESSTPQLSAIRVIWL